MTICIASICDDGKSLVVAADQMFTMQAPLNLEFEPPVSKIEKIGTNCVILAAGNSVFAQELTNRTRSKLQAGRPAPVSTVGLQLKSEYEAFRGQTIEENIVLATLGEDFASFRKKGGILPAYLQLQPMIYQQIIAQAAQFNLGMDFIVAGVEPSGGHIFYVGHPGTLMNFDKLGHASIGSGALHAAMSLSLSKQTPRVPLIETLFSVYSAKRAAEVAPGVGQATEMVVISVDATWSCPTKLIDALSRKYAETVAKEKPNFADIGKEYAEQRKIG